MIKIQIPPQQLDEENIEETHWRWFWDNFRRIRNKGRKNGILKHVLGIEESDLETLVKKPLNDPGFIKLNDEINARLKAYEKYPNYKRRLKSIEKIFKYDDFTEDKLGWNSYAYFKALKISVCPYCNRTYVFTVDKTETFEKKGKKFERISKKITAPQIDHFFPQDKYPHLACSLYNFVPSCSICNHIKSNDVKDIINPHIEGFEKDGSFRVSFDKECENLISLNNVNIKIRKTTPFSLNPVKNNEEKEKCTRIKNSVELFQLIQIYKKHTIELKDLFDRYRNYCQPKRKDILRLFHEDELKNDIEGLTEKQIDAVLSLYAKKMKNMFLGLPLGAEGKEYPLRKFKEDIIEQLDETRKKMKNEVP